MPFYRIWLEGVIQLKEYLREVLNLLNNYGALLGALATFFTALVALYLGYFKSEFRKPRLKLFFNENKEYPYFHKLAFDKFYPPVKFRGEVIYLFKPGFNSRVKIVNVGKSTAKRVQARVEKIEFYNEQEKSAPTSYYHPTNVKWSGELNYQPVDIVSKSYFFLDVFYAINETSKEIFSFNEIKYKPYIKENALKQFIEIVKPTEEVYWNVWVDNSYSRGIPEKYYKEAKIIIYFIINAKNCEPLKFEAIINWSYKDWDQPDIKIKQGKNYINNDKGGNNK